MNPRTHTRTLCRAMAITWLFSICITVIPTITFAEQHINLAEYEATQAAYDAQAGRQLIEAQAQSQTAQEKPKVKDCSVWNGSFITEFDYCIATPIAATIGTALFTGMAWLLGLASYLFDWLVVHTIVQFGAQGELYQSVREGVEKAWTVFRDLSNIVIIGMFVFIAISFIIGNQSYGTKIMIARVLIVAILINFSLLFTKLIIDASNFTAQQFYNSSQIAQPQTNLSWSQLVTTEATATGVSGSFMRLMGVATVSDTYGALREGAGSWYMALIYGFFAAVVLLAAAIVLFYGSFLLVARALLLIYLMLTSSIAFATYLIPKASESSFGWNTWWSSLLKAAVFAPLLMVFLWVTITVGRALAASGEKGGTLGGLMSNFNESNMWAFFKYIIILGLLFASIRVANMFSKSIAGFNWSAMAAAIPLGFAARSVGMAARFSVGGLATRRSERLTRMAKDQAAKGNTVRAKTLDWGAQKYKTIGTKDFNLANTALYKGAVSGPAGLKGTLAGETKLGGFIGREDRIKKKAAERSERLTYTKEELEGMRDKALAQANISAKQAQIVDNKTALTKEKAELQKQADDVKKDRAPILEAIKNIRDKEDSGLSLSDAEKADLADKQIALNEQDKKIADTAGKIDEYTKKLEDVTKEESDLKEKRARVIREALPKGTVRDDGTLIPQEQRRQEAARGFAHTRPTNLPWVLFGQNPENDRIASKMRKAVEEHDSDKTMKKQLALLKKLTDQQGEQAEREEQRFKETRSESRQAERRTEKAIREAGQRPHEEKS